MEISIIRQFVFASILMSIFLVGCSQGQHKQAKVSNHDKEKRGVHRPAWIDSPLDGCNASELCAVGEGSGRMMAQGKARENLAKIFETRVKASTKSTQQSRSTIRQDVVQGSVSEDYLSSVQEMTDQVLEGTLIKQRFVDRDGTHYALAALNKNEAAARFRKEMGVIDDQISHLVQENRRSSLNRAQKLFEKRRVIDRKYAIVTGRSFPTPITEKSVLEKKRQKASESVVVLFDFRDMTDTGELIGKLLVSELTQNDYKVITKKGAHHFVINAKLEKQIEHMNVKGFERYRFILGVQSLDTTGKKLGAMNYSTVQAGRSPAQAFEMALPAISNFIKENLDELNMD